MKLVKDEFLKTEFGGELENVIITWDKALEMQWLHDYTSEEYKVSFGKLNGASSITLF